MSASSNFGISSIGKCGNNIKTEVRSQRSIQCKSKGLEYRPCQRAVSRSWIRSAELRKGTESRTMAALCLSVPQTGLKS
jgi:hypothetical protein